MPDTTQLWRMVEGWMDQQRFKITQAALAKDIGVARTAVSQWKYGVTRPTPENMRALQSATGLRYRDLLDAMLQDMGYLPAGGASDGPPITKGSNDPELTTPAPPAERRRSKVDRGASSPAEPRLIALQPDQ